MKQIADRQEAQWSLHEQTGITVRPLAAVDAASIHAMHQRLSPESLYFRYLRHRGPTLDEITTVCRLDPTQSGGFVATVQAEPVVIVGLAYYVRQPQTAEPTAEVGILVEDQFQEQGIGRHLWRRVLEHAELNGILRLLVWSHPNNLRMARLVRSAGLPYVAKIDGGLREYRITLNAQPARDPEQYSNQVVVKHTSVERRPLLVEAPAFRRYEATIFEGS